MRIEEREKSGVGTPVRLEPTGGRSAGGGVAARLARVRFPHPLVLLVGGIFLAALLTWLLPAGAYERQHDPVTGKDVVVAGTYHAVPAQPVGGFGALVAIPEGMMAAGDVIFFVFLIGGAFAVVERTGALGRAVDGLVSALRGREALVIPIVSVVFAAGGALEHMQEEILALIPALLLLTRRMGYDPLVAAAMSLGAAAVAAAFSPIDPFQVGIAQQLAHVPLGSGGLFRSLFMVVALAIWIWGTMRVAARTRGVPEDVATEEERARAAAGAPAVSSARAMVVLLIVLATFVLFVVGLYVWQWDFIHMAAVFFLMGIVAGLAGGLGVAGTSDAFVDGFRTMAFAALLIGFARAISVVLQEGQVIDTIVHGLFTPLAALPVLVSGAGMVAVQTALHFPVPSVSGQAALTMPVLVPLADLLGMSRQVMILTYQYGAGLCEILTPTNGALVAILAACGVRLERWLRFIAPLLVALFALGLAAVWIGMLTGLR